MTTTRYIQVKVKDARGATVTKSLTLAVTGTVPLAITTASLPDAVAGSAYSQTLAAFGGKDALNNGSPYFWTVVGGSLPPGLALSTAGVIAGTPTAVVTVTVTVQAKDGAGTLATRTLTLNVATPPTVTVLTQCIPTATVGTPYSLSLAPQEELLRTDGPSPAINFRTA